VQGRARAWYDGCGRGRVVTKGEEEAMLRWVVECGTVAGVWFLGGVEAAFWAGACLVLLARMGGIGCGFARGDGG
jgi:hypothetical protein